MYRIGEFSKISGLSVKTLRYYAEIGLLIPKEIDPYTGYRFYSIQQMSEALRIQALKELGFSLDSIKAFGTGSAEQLRQRETELQSEIDKMTVQLQKIKSLKAIMKEGNAMMNPIAVKEIGEGKTDLVACCTCHKSETDAIYPNMIQYLVDNQYQIVGRNSISEISADENEIQIPVHLLHPATELPDNDDIQLPFENDEAVVGRWRTVDCCFEEDDFNPEHLDYQPLDGDITELYFLPEGEKYWAFSWTKGYVISEFGTPQMQGLNPYYVREIRGKKYMFLSFKDRGCFFRGAKPCLIVLEQLDNRKYSKQEIRKRDKLMGTFTEDVSVLGKWKALDFVRSVDRFEPDRYNAGFDRKHLYFKKIEFHEEGKCVVQYGNDRLCSPKVNWTAGAVQEVEAELCQKYERKVINETEYLFVEFKSGDYLYNGQMPWWYVFTRAVE